MQPFCFSTMDRTAKVLSNFCHEIEQPQISSVYSIFPNKVPVKIRDRIADDETEAELGGGGIIITVCLKYCCYLLKIPVCF